jgi:hypothetical protein
LRLEPQAAILCSLCKGRIQLGANILIFTLNHAETNINSQRVIASIHSYNDEALQPSFASSYFLKFHTVAFAIYHLYLGDKNKDCQQGLHPWTRFRERPQRRYKCWFSIPLSYDINRGKKTHSRYVRSKHFSMSFS